MWLRRRPSTQFGVPSLSATLSTQAGKSASSPGMASSIIRSCCLSGSPGPYPVRAAVAADDTVARHEWRHRIGAVGRAHRPACLRSAQGEGNLPVRCESRRGVRFLPCPDLAIERWYPAGPEATVKVRREPSKYSAISFSACRRCRRSLFSVAGMTSRSLLGPDRMPATVEAHRANPAAELVERPVPRPLSRLGRPRS